MRLDRRGWVLTFLAVILATFAATAGAQTKLLRFPDVWGDKVAFCYAGDIWVAPADGGTATRLTAHPGLELFPKFSPDGRWIAFTGQYDGDEQVYVIPASGGVPKQLTWYPAQGPLTPRWGYDNQVYGWTVDGKAVLFRSMREGYDHGDSRLYTVSVEGGLPVALPMPVAGAGTFSPDGTKVAYSPLFRDFRTWKRYQGGWAEDLWVFDLATHDAFNFTDNPRTDRDPMWIGDAVYFASDRDGTLNIYRYDLATKQTAEVTHSTTYDVRWPSYDRAGKIVYELGGELHVLDTSTGADKPISIFVPNDGVAMRPARMAVEKFIEDFSLAPKAERALFVARGDVFTVPIEKGPTRNLTNSSRYHDKWARWSPDGSQIAYISDRTGEEEVWLIAQDGSGAARQLTRGGNAMRYAPEWSPDGKRLAFSDKDGRLWVVAVADGAVVGVAKDRQGALRDYAWSPDGAFLAFSLSNPSGTRSVAIWSLADGKLHPVTDPMFNAQRPAWDPEGNYVYFLSDRDFAPQLSTVEFNFAGNRTTGIFALALRKDVPNPFPPESDEVKVEKAAPAKPEGAKKADGDKAKEVEAPKPVRIDFEGLAARVARVPVEADNYAGLVATKEYLLVLRSSAPFLGREPEQPTSLQAFSLKDRKLSALVDEADDFAISGDGAKVLVKKGATYTLVDVNPKAKESKDAHKPVSTKEMTVDRVPAQEWAEIFDEVWRRYRDFFYVTNMHGYDWRALGDRYRALLPFVAHRSDLNYVLGEMVAELNIGHAYIEGGDYEIPPRPRVALPGAVFELDKAAGRYRIARIMQGQNEEERYRAPLTEVGVDARQGDYVLAIDGVDLPANENPYRLLKGKADHPVTLTLNSKPEMNGARLVSYRPITTETDLKYLDWVAHNREIVDRLSGGRIGYLHVPDMAEDGIREFIKWYYPQIRKEGLIIDDRANGGGFVSQLLIERLRTTLLGTGFSRTVEDTQTYPQTTFIGPMACLLNETSASDGDIFPYMFRQAGLGPLIGKRSWGGVVGINGHGPLIDGGIAYVPEGGTASADGRWVIEGHGVDPDIVVENDPKSLIEGRDPQLERAVAEVTKAMATHRTKLPARPPNPVKTK
ncbi:MAG TPA: S41 family peptidase [Thermoanaerobaculaceae bacterium]|nr:S41 family peptidase [Thermoanaerobaculaceae bacterium]